MSHILRDLIPETFPRWKKIEVVNFNGRCVARAQRSGITIQIVRNETGWWTVTKFKGGQVLASKTTKRIPQAVTDKIIEHGGRWPGVRVPRQRTAAEPARSGG